MDFQLNGSTMMDQPQKQDSQPLLQDFEQYYYCINEDGIITDVSDRLGELFHFNVTDFINRHVRDLASSTHIMAQLTQGDMDVLRQQTSTITHFKQGHEGFWNQYVAVKSYVRHDDSAKKMLLCVINRNYYPDEPSADSIINQLSGMIYMYSDSETLRSLNHEQYKTFGAVDSILGNAVNVQDLHWHHNGTTGKVRQCCIDALIENNRKVLHDQKAIQFLEKISHVDDEDNEKGQSYLSVKKPLRVKGATQGIVGCSIEISDRLHAEQQLLMAKRLAEQENIEKSKFIAQLTHDIRTPISGIISMAEEIAAIGVDEKLGQIEDYANNIHFSAKKLLKLLNEVLDFSKGKAHFKSSATESFDLHEVLAQTMDVMRPSITMKGGIETGVEYNADCPRLFSGKKFPIERILLNLLSNAVKFTQAGSIFFHVNEVKREAQVSTVQISITDTGMGIPLDKQDRIFEPFQTAGHDHSIHDASSGLGLYNVSQLTEEIGGSITFESTPGKGSTFIVTLPITVTDTKDQATDSDEPVIHEQDVRPIDATRSILLVEDDTLSRKVGCLRLGKFYQDVDSVANAMEAIRLFESKRYDVVYLDMGLPDMTGAELAMKLREIEARDNLPKTTMVMVTAELSDSLDKYQKFGINKTLPKPITENKIRYIEFYHT